MFEPRGENAFDHSLHGGTAPITMQWHFLDELRLPVAVQTWELPPGGTEGMHSHSPDDAPLEEFYQVLDGTARMQLGDQVHHLGPGDSVYAPSGVDHDLANTGDGILRVLVIWGEPGRADFSGFGSARAARARRRAVPVGVLPGTTPAVARRPDAGSSPVDG